MPKPKDSGKRNLTITLDRQTVQRARVIAARRSLSISGLVAEQIEALAHEEEAYERAERQAMSLLEQGFHLGVATRINRNELHDR